MVDSTAIKKSIIPVQREIGVTYPGASTIESIEPLEPIAVTKSKRYTPKIRANAYHPGEVLPRSGVDELLSLESASAPLIFIKRESDTREKITAHPGEVMKQSGVDEMLQLESTTA